MRDDVETFAHWVWQVAVLLMLMIIAWRMYHTDPVDTGRTERILCLQIEQDHPGVDPATTEPSPCDFVNNP